MEEKNKLSDEQLGKVSGGTGDDVEGGAFEPSHTNYRHMCKDCGFNWTTGMPSHKCIRCGSNNVSNSWF